MLTIRPATPADLPAIQAIYAHHVLTGTGSFEETPPDLDEMTRRFHDVTGRGLPYLVAEDDSGIAGYAYAGLFRTRSAYRFTVEDSVYVAANRQGQGIGARLLADLIAACRDRGVREILAVIGDSNNAGSIGVHRRLGFRPIGTLERVGLKFGRWLDVVMMQLSLVDEPATK